MPYAFAWYPVLRSSIRLRSTPFKIKQAFFYFAIKILENPRQMYFIWVLFVLPLNKHEEKWVRDPRKKEWSRKGMSQEMTQRNASTSAFFLD